MSGAPHAARSELPPRRVRGRGGARATAVAPAAPANENAPMPDAIAISRHDDCPEAAARVVDAGLSEANAAAAPLHEVRPISCFARPASGEVIGGVVGRTWGSCCELQQLWVSPQYRRRGLGARLIGEFEAHARARGCATFYLETFSFQAPSLYRSLGYAVAYAHAVYPHGIVRYTMVKDAPRDRDTA